MSQSETIWQNLERIREMAPGLELPPPVFGLMKAELGACEPGVSMHARFPFQARFNNPAHVMQGGMIAVAFDCIFGIFSYISTAKPTTSLDLNTAFIQAVTAADEALLVEVRLVSQTKSYVLMDGRATNPAGALKATATTRMQILDPARMRLPR